MPVQLTIRNVPDAVRNVLAARAALQGRSMQEYLLLQLEALAQRPSIDEWLAQVQARKQRAPDTVCAERIVPHRDADRR